MVSFKKRETLQVMLMKEEVETGETNTRAHKSVVPVMETVPMRAPAVESQLWLYGLNSRQAHWLFELLQMAEAVALMRLGAHY